MWEKDNLDHSWSNKRIIGTEKNNDEGQGESHARE